MTATEKTRPIVTFDADLLHSVNDSLNLREPQWQALAAVIDTFETHPQGFTGTCDLATAVGKTYLAASIIAYLARNEAKVRNFLIVVPNKVVYNKTIDNFTKGHSKSVLNGMGVAPVVVTPENFASAGIASWLYDDRMVKVFVFNVQQLLSDTKEMSRRVRAIQEYLGTSLYTHLSELPDLVVLSDEHHMYSAKAVRYNAAIQDLEPLATIGLTATPECTTRREGITPTGRVPKIHTHSPGGVDGKCKIIFHYPLAMAIAEKFVKTPLIVGRTDDQDSDEIKLRDGLVILDDKKRAADLYAENQNAVKVRPIMLVVCKSIKHAQETARTLRSMPDISHDEVLEINSRVDEESLEALDSVESTDSKARVIVSVSMLGVGWDVKNVFVILSLRASVADVLTEQTLGRGMRLPWGTYTGWESLDTVDVVAHESYQQLIDKAQILLEGLASAEHMHLAARGFNVDSDTTLPHPRGNQTDANDFTLGITPMDERKDKVAAQVAAMQDRTITPDRKLALPVAKVTSKAVYADLKDLREIDFQAAGLRWATRDRAELVRNVQRFVKDGDTAVYAAYITEDKLHASLGKSVPGYVEDWLVKALSKSKYVKNVPETDARARVLARAFVHGAGGEDAVLPNLRVVTTELETVLAKHHAKINPEKEISVTVESKLLTRSLEYKNASTNTSATFDKKTAYNGWSKGLHSYVKFDSGTERSAAVLFDNDSQVKLWAWLDKSQKDLPIPREGGGYYYPDFYVNGVDGKHYVVEIKADYQMNTPTTLEKKNNAVQWARTVSDKDGSKYGEWVYLLASESMVKAAMSFGQLRQSAVKELSRTETVSVEDHGW